MISIISDIHLSDGTTSFNVHKEAFLKVFKRNVINSAIDDKSIKEVKIILLGDIFDFVRTDYWLKLDPDERPWNGTLDKSTAMNNNTELIKNHYIKVLNNIFAAKDESAKSFIETLNSIKSELKNHDSTKNIPVEIHYVIGNHDRILNNFIELREMISSKLTSYKPEEIYFTNEFESDEYTVLCRHGHEYDGTNYGREIYAFMNKISLEKLTRFDKKLYAVQSIGEVVTAELMSGIIYRLSNKQADPKFISLVKDVNNVRPLTDALIWLYWFSNNLKDFDIDFDIKKNRKLLMDSFKDSLNGVLSTELAKTWDNLVKEVWFFKGDITDRFELLLNIIKDKDFYDVKEIVEVLKPVYSFFSGKSVDDYALGAKSGYASGAQKNKQYLIMGHTHEALNVYFKGDVDGKVNMYINSGTYLPYIEKIKNSPVVSFADANQLTLLNIYRNDEDLEYKSSEHPTLDLWNGIKRKRYKNSIS